MPRHSSVGADRRIALFEAGFRPFFLFAALYSIFATLAWFAVYVLGVQPGPATATWHAHEMIFGYGMAVVAGFLLTASQNWTGLRTLHHAPLAVLLTLWLAARVLPYLWAAVPTVLVAALDLGFLAFLIGAVTRVLSRSGNRKQFVILFLVALLLLSNVAYYIGVAGHVPGTQRSADLSGLYALIGLIIIVAGRVVPFFTERGVGYPVQLTDVSWTLRANMVLFPLFWISELTNAGDVARALLSAALFLVNAYRLWGWYTPGIWKKPLIWVLHVAYGFLAAGFLFTLMAALTNTPPFPATHAFAYGGLGLMTLGMMSRVTLGHTGRSVHRPPGALAAAFGLLVAGSLVRVLAPIALPSVYLEVVALSQALWVAAFGIFVVTLGGALLRPRIDGKPG